MTVDLTPANETPVRSVVRDSYTQGSTLTIRDKRTGQAFEAKILRVNGRRVELEIQHDSQLEISCDRR